jgi:acetylornithine deacetylase/succinyl-diaminopimelate desuccinylase-like protein
VQPEPSNPPGGAVSESTASTGTPAEREVADICRDLIAIDTSNYGDDSGPGERKAAELVATLLSEVGLEPEVVSAETWSESPLPRSRLAAEFRGMEDRDLLTWGCTIVTRREAPSG